MDVPKCELCEKGEVSCLINTDNEGNWEWWCDECEARESYRYCIGLFDCFFHSPAETVDWLAHMSEKGSWFDALKFMRKFRQLRSFSYREFINSKVKEQQYIGIS